MYPTVVIRNIIDLADRLHSGIETLKRNLGFVGKDEERWEREEE